MKILLCTDGSTNGLSAVFLGCKIAARLKAHLVVLCVLEDKTRSLDQALQAVVEVAQASDVPFDLVGRRGRLVEEMLGYMLDTEYDLVIVGYYARSFLEKMIWGSLAARIAHELPVSVLIVRDQRETIRRLLIGISGGGFTQDCTDWGGSIAQAFDAHVTLLHVSPTPPLMYAGLEEVRETLAEFLQTDTAEAHAMKQAVRCLGEMGVDTTVELAFGLPERELLRVAHDQDVDLLVVGSAWAAQPLSRAFLRNITEKVLLNTRRPVLVVRPTGR